ncbi:RNA polymerase sigma factor [Bengtsoniella intestinalis]|uniref:RNA polymerase sigma factor n=1 Tax=Bengtsoniella intestinalis TaxID=3073143 RepID=UPI00391F1C89
MTQQEQWIAAAKAGDQAAFEQLLELYQQKVYALCLRRCTNPDDAQEAAQEALIAAWQGLPFFKGESSFSTWLYRLTANACTDFLRREGRHANRVGASFDNPDAPLHIPDTAPSPHQALEQSELRTAIDAGLARLSDQHREVLLLRTMHQRSYDEIAQILDLEVGTVKSRINRGRLQLRKFLQESGNFLPSSASKVSEKEGCQ